jgi:hypothetical protein
VRDGGDAGLAVASEGRPQPRPAAEGGRCGPSRRCRCRAPGRQPAPIAALVPSSFSRCGAVMDWRSRWVAVKKASL